MKAGILIGHMKATNESSLIRTAEAFGISLVFVVNERGRELEYSISQGADKQVLFLEFHTYTKLIRYTRQNNHSIVCIENMSEAIELSEVSKYPINPIFVTGNEGQGVPEELLDYATMVIQIRQGMGYIPCLNTAIAASIVIHDFFRKEK